MQAARRTWNTKDGPTNANLNFLESLAEPWSGMTAELFLNNVRGVIGVKRMLPKAVGGHFQLPSLYVGNAPEGWSAERIETETRALCDALQSGLASAFADATLKKDGDADLSDRPATKGEEMSAAIDAYRDRRGSAELSTLRQAVSGTSLQRYMDQLDKWLVRTRPSSPDRPIAYEIASALGDMARRADDWHAEPASYAFTEHAGTA